MLTDSFSLAGMLTERQKKIDDRCRKKDKKRKKEKDELTEHGNGLHILTYHPLMYVRSKTQTLKSASSQRFIVIFYNIIYICKFA